MSKLIELNIRYDPDYPFDWVTEQEYYENLYPTDKRPRFPYRGSHRSGAVIVLGLCFNYRQVRSGGFDPYQGDDWDLQLGSFRLTLSTMICCVAELTFKRRHIFNIREYEMKSMPYLIRKLVDFLEYRYEWEQRNRIEDPYGDLSYYE